MGRFRRGPSNRDLLKYKNRRDLEEWAVNNNWPITKENNVTWVGNTKCTFDKNDKLLMVE